MRNMPVVGSAKVGSSAGGWEMDRGHRPGRRSNRRGRDNESYRRGRSLGARWWQAGGRGTWQCEVESVMGSPVIESRWLRGPPSHPLDDPQLGLRLVSMTTLPVHLSLQTECLLVKPPDLSFMVAHLGCEVLHMHALENSCMPQMSVLCPITLT